MKSAYIKTTAKLALIKCCDNITISNNCNYHSVMSGLLIALV